MSRLPACLYAIEPTTEKFDNDVPMYVTTNSTVNWHVMFITIPTDDARCTSPAHARSPAIITIKRSTEQQVYSIHDQQVLEKVKR